MQVQTDVRLRELIADNQCMLFDMAWGLVEGRERRRAARRKAENDELAAARFGELIGLKVARTPFGFYALAAGLPHGGPRKPNTTSQRFAGQAIDHPWYYRQPKPPGRAAAIVVHLYNYRRAEEHVRRFADAEALTAARFEGLRSWYYPDFATMVVYTAENTTLPGSTPI